MKRTPLTILLTLSTIVLFLGTGCTTLSKFEQGVVTDIHSPQGKAVLESALQSGLAITRAVLASTSPTGAIAAIPADLAAANALAATVEAFSTLPTNSASLSKTLAAGAGEGKVAVQAAPAIAQLIVAVQQQNPALPPSAIAQAVALGVYTAANPTP